MVYNLAMQPQYYGAAAEYNKPTNKNFFTGKLLMIIVGSLIGLLLLLLAFTIIGSFASGPRNDIARLAARAKQLQDVIEKNSAALKDSDLRDLTAEADLYAISGARQLQNAYGGTLPDSILASEADTTSAARLSDAVTQGKYDQEFLAILKDKVAQTLTLAQKVQTQSSGQQTKGAAGQTAANMSAISDQLNAIQL